MYRAQSSSGKLAVLAGKVRGVNGQARTTGAPEREVLLTRPVVLLTLVAFAALFGFQLLLSVVPVYADEASGSSGAGLATAAFMLTTVLTQIQMPRILGRYGYRRALAAGLLFLGVPALFYAYAQTLLPILAVTLARGVGFGIVTVVFAALIVELAPPHRRGEALGLLGVAITLPTIFCNALGLWLAGEFGFGVVFLLGGIAPLLGLGVIPWIRSSSPATKEESGAGFFTGLGRPHLRRIYLLFAVTTMAAGVVLTFLPLAVPGSGVFSAASALLVVGITSTASRWWAGRFGDRRDPCLLLAPGLIACASGMVCLPLGGVILLIGAVLFGTGFGLLQNSTLILMMGRVSKSEYGLGSTLWNSAFDAGTGIGAFTFGFVISAVGFSWSFFICSAMVASALLLVLLDHSST
jgi:predicted MFS family arabinose efflux permease